MSGLGALTASLVATTRTGALVREVAVRVCARQPVGIRTLTRLFLGYFLLGKQKKQLGQLAETCLGILAILFTYFYLTL